MSRIVATFLYVGYLRPAPGTWGSAAALPVGYALHVLGGWQMIALGAGAAFLAGWWATVLETRDLEDHDPSEIVIDEVAGQLLALIPVSLFMHNMEAAPTIFPWQGVFVAFLLFRLFDIWKPGAIGWADRRGDALGVMLDDVFAGIFAAAVLILGSLFATNWFVMLLEFTPWNF